MWRPTARRLGSASEPDRRDIVLPIERDVLDCRTLYNWHGGQGTAVYSLASVGCNTGPGARNSLVSLTMVRNAIAELRSDARRARTRASRRDRRELATVIGQLETIAAYPDEHSAEAYGLGTARRH